ncbi:AAA family ATPase [Virgibacillus sp. FSP13]
MKQIKLQKLVLTNFKGIKQFELNANGDVLIFGDNGTGKTTLFDGFVWDLFDKDSQNKKDFQIKTLVNGKPVSKLDHEVEATLLVDGQQLVLKKSYKEKWTKKRGNPTPDFTGHTTDYFVNGVPSKKKEFEEKVSSIVDENIFKLLTSPSYFNELHWKKRRDLLLEIAGGVTDQEVINSNQDLSKLTDVLSGRSIEDHKKMIAAKRKEINQELDRIPIRIDEINRNLPDVNGLDKARIESQLTELNNQIEAKQGQISDIRNGSEVNNIRKKISDIDLQIANVKNEHAQQGQQQLYSLKTKLQEEQSNVNILQSKVKNNEDRKKMNDSNVNGYKEQIQSLRDQWAEQNAQEFDHGSNCNCPTCGQELPEEQLEEAKTNFNRNKSSLLETITEKGKSLGVKVEQLKNDNMAIDLEIQKLNEQINHKQEQIEKLRKQINDAEINVQPIEKNASYQKLMQDRQALEQRINEMQKSVQESVQSVQQEIGSLIEKQSVVQVDLSKLAQSDQSLKRIAELEEQEKGLAEQFEQLEHELYLTEEFIRTKVNLLEEKINSKFKYARFNLFKENINGGLEEVCETTFDGVPYGSGLNNAARINVGLDIINTLSQHYGVQAPIFVDNAESVTRLIDIDAQVISLVVSETDKELRIENKTKVEVA